MDHYLRKDDFFRETGVPLAVVRRSPQPPYPLHSHEFAELVIAYGGKGIHFTEEDECEIAAGNVFMIHGHRRHGYRQLDQLELVNLVFMPESIAALGVFPALQALLPMPGDDLHGGMTPVLTTDPTEMVEIMHLIDAMEKEEQDKKDGYRAMMTAFFLQLITLLLRRRQAAESSSPRQRLGEVMRYMEKHYRDEITLEALAKVARISSSTLTRYFYRCTGFTPVEYLIHYRIKKACAQLLTEPDKSIAEVGYESGFSDSNYFTRTFRRKTGKSPREFRKNGKMTTD